MRGPVARSTDGVAVVPQTAGGWRRRRAREGRPGADVRVVLAPGKGGSALGSCPSASGGALLPSSLVCGAGIFFFYLFIFLNCGKHIPCDAPTLRAAGEASERPFRLSPAGSL